MPAPVHRSTLRQRLALGAVVAAPLLAVVASALQPKDTNSAATEVARFAAHRDRYFAAALLMAVAFWLFIPASTALVRLFRDRGSRVGGVSCMALAIGGLTFGAGTLMAGTVDMIVTGHGVTRAAAVNVVHGANHNAVAGLPWIVGILLFVGFLGIAGTLFYARTVPWWQPALLTVGAVCVFLSGSGPASAPLGLPLVAGFAALAWSISRLQAPATAPATVDVTAAVPNQPAAPAPDQSRSNV